MAKLAVVRAALDAAWRNVGEKMERFPALPNEISRGAFIINRLTGIACEALGESRLAKPVPKLKPDEARPVIAALEKVGAARVWEIRR